MNPCTFALTNGVIGTFWASAKAQDCGRSDGPRRLNRASHRREGALQFSDKGGQRWHQASPKLTCSTTLLRWGGAMQDILTGGGLLLAAIIFGSQKPAKKVNAAKW